MDSSDRKRLPHISRAVTKRHPYHVVMTLVRGAPESHRRVVREIFTHWVGATSERYAMAFNLTTLMPDHIHLVVETPRDERDLSNALRFLCSKVALAVNRAFDRKGALFRDRFFSRILKTPSELIHALRYVAFNPVRARLCLRPEHWLAGGVRDYVAGRPLPRPWIAGAPGKSTRSIGIPAGSSVQGGGDPPRSLWSFHGYQFRILGFFDDPRSAFLKILAGATRPRAPSKGRQLRLPFDRGLPRRP